MGLLQKIPRKAWTFLNIFNKLIRKDPRKIFIYSNLGFRDNVKAVFDYLVAKGYNEHYKITVSLNDYEDYIETAEKNVRYVSNVRGLLSFFTSKYCYYCFGKYPVKPPKRQIVFNLWHGMPLKRVGNMVRGCEKINYNYFTYVLCTSEYFRDIMKASFRASDKQIFISGQPRTDVMMTPLPPEDKMSALSEFYSEKNKFTKMLLWLPTYRDGGGSELDILSNADLERLDMLLKQKEWSLLVKLHPLSKKKKIKGNYSNISFASEKNLRRTNIGFYQLMAMADCLITDYSSAYFDYMLLDRPMGFVINDMESYGDERGFTVPDPTTIMPGEIIRNGEDFIGFVRKVTDGVDEYASWRKKLNKKFNFYTDGRNCERVTSMIPRIRFKNGQTEGNSFEHKKHIEKNTLSQKISEKGLP